MGSYLGLIPCEDSSAARWRLGHVSKQGNSLVRYRLIQSALAATRGDHEWHRKYARLSIRKNHAVAKVAMARKLAVRLFWMCRQEWDYRELKKFGSHAGSLA